MRITGTLLALAGLVAAAVGLFMGCGALFTWNGRHAADVHSVTPGAPATYPLTAHPGRRYTIAVQVVFDRQGLQARESGSAEVSAKLPLVARVTDSRGTTLAETVGWLDPEEPPTVLFGSHPSLRHADTTELVAERMVGSFFAQSRDPLEIRVDLGEDRIARARILEGRVVVYDDVIPPSIKRMLSVAAAGGLALAVGLGLVIRGFFRRRSRRGGIRGA